MDLDLAPSLWVLSASVLAAACLRLIGAVLQHRLRRRTRQAIEKALDDDARR